jgi:MFS family permease
VARRLGIPVLLRQIAFRRYWTAQTISYLGDQVTIIAFPLTAVLALHAGAFEVGVLTAVASLPTLLLALHAGAFVDRRGRRRRLMIMADVLRAVLLATVPIAYWLDALTLPQLYLIAFATGSLAVIFNVGTTSLFPALVPREQFVRANSLIRGSYSFSWVAGPSAGGLLVQLLSGPVAIVLDVLSFLGSALLLKSIRPAEPPPEPAGRRQVLDGLRFVLRTPALFLKSFVDSWLNFFYSIYFALFILYAADELRLSAGLIGLILGAGAVGALLGSALTSRAGSLVGVGPAFMLGCALYPGALILTPLASGPVWLVTGLLIVAEFGSGFGLMLCDITGMSIQQAVTPDRLRARVQGAYLLFNNGIRPLGAVAGGVLGTWLGLRPTLLLAGVAGVGCVLLLLPSPIRRMRELPDEADYPASSAASSSNVSA